MLNTLQKHADNLKTILDIEGEEGQFEYLIDIGKKGPGRFAKFAGRPRA